VTGKDTVLTWLFGEGGAARLSVAPSIFDEMVLAVDYAGSFSRLGCGGIAYEFASLVGGGNFEHVENVVRLTDGPPDIKEPKASRLVRCFMRSEHRFPAQEVRNAVATQHVSHQLRFYFTRASVNSSFVSLP
jgi:hypothetical protein